MTGLRILLLFGYICWGITAPLLAQNWTTTPVTAQKGMVVSDHPEATKVGVEILQKGGNAIDASIAVQFALAVVYPEAGNIGGGGFLVYRPAKGEAVTLDYRETAPAAATQDMFLDAKGEADPMRSVVGTLAAGVPGTVDGMWQAHQRYGKLSWKELVEPAWLLAGRGFLLTEQQAEKLNAFREYFIKYNGTPVDFYLKNRWKAGDRMRQYALSLTLERIMNEGREGFYAGQTADLIVEEMRRSNGLISYADLAGYKSVWRMPYSFDYKGYRIHSMPPPSSGGIVLHQLLYVSGQHPLKKWGHNSAEAIHLMAEAERRMYADRAHYIADPDFVKVPIAQLTDPAYLNERMASYSPVKATPSAEVGAGTLRPEADQTTHYNVVDAEGNAVSVTTTLNGLYGCMVVVGDAGFLLNNEMDDFAAKTYSPNSFELQYGQANLVAPGKRPLSSMTPVIIEKDGKFILALGAAGGPTIITAVYQVMLNVLEYGLNVQAAVSAPRVHHQWLPDVLRVEEGRIKAATLKKLEKMGHTVKTRAHIALLNAIHRLPDGTLQGGAEPRGDAAAAGY
ncbi:MAG: gamma-glutamyltransferase [Bacteroidetes bacterium]|nr:gamma-glutamyltransferase [Bacteroidota bacterium]